MFICWSDVLSLLGICVEGLDLIKLSSCKLPPTDSTVEVTNTSQLWIKDGSKSDESHS